MDRTILVVDDDSRIHEVFGILAAAEPGVLLQPGARDGREALQRVAQHCPDAVVLDVRMEPMGGLEVLPLLRAACAGLVIAMYSSDAERSRGTDLGADAVFDKVTHDPGHVLDEVRRLLDERSDPVPRPRASPEARSQSTAPRRAAPDAHRHG